MPATMPGTMTRKGLRPINVDIVHARIVAIRDRNQPGAMNHVHLCTAIARQQRVDVGPILSSMLRKLGEVSGATRRFFELVDLLSE